MRVWVHRAVVQLVSVSHLDHPAEIHHCDAIRDVAHHREVVGDEQVGEAELLLQVVEQVEDLRLDRHVECRHGLVQHDERRVERQGSGDADPLPLTARELVRVPVRVLGLQPTDLQQTLTSSRRFCLDPSCAP